MNPRDLFKSLAASLVVWAAVAVLAMVTLVVMIEPAAPANAEQRAPEGTFPPFDVVCTEGGIETWRAEVRTYENDPKAAGYIRFWYWDRNEWHSTNAVCDITDNRNKYR